MIQQKQEITNELKDKVCSLHNKGSESKIPLRCIGYTAISLSTKYIFKNNNKVFTSERLNRILLEFYLKYDCLLKAKGLVFILFNESENQRMALKVGKDVKNTPSFSE